MDYIGSTAGQVKADCQAFQRDVSYLEHLLGKQRSRIRQNREWTGDEAHEKLAELQPLEESYCDTNEEIWQPEDGEEEGDWDEDTQQSEDWEVVADWDEDTQQSEDWEVVADWDEDTQQSEDWEVVADWDEDTQQSEDCEEDSETLSTTKILTETDLHRYYKEVQEAYIIKQQLFASELQFERSTNKVLLDELEKLRASNNEISRRYEAENLRAAQQASHLKAEFEKAVMSQMHSFQAEQNLLRLQIMEEMRCLRKRAAEEKMLLQRQVEELTSQLSLKKERENSSIRSGRRKGMRRIRRRNGGRSSRRKRRRNGGRKQEEESLWTNLPTWSPSLMPSLLQNLWRLSCLRRRPKIISLQSGKKSDSIWD
ncbi:unnamed protein product [Pleuronectes platessa]|uniref:Uncharacterized protein n=1 Tax=Pleuronectes platessa TaxID=8262 RepID=A0A9N7UBP0_PLEPL|nr:unnamed protein product [Pleuronectes platessa]